ncbi:MAG: AAA family ATPase [Verrucomicrobiaceae bacterium]|nr:MAG: AAA family ATPase [Verrucomicrobiaceae bacterium]
MLPHTGFVGAVRFENRGEVDGNMYPFGIPAIRTFERLELHPAVTFVIGENGMGKSTLIEAIAVRYGFNAEGGSRNFRFDTRASHSPLYRHLVLERGPRRPTDGYFLRAESFYNVATEIEKLDAEPSGAPPIGPAYGGRGLHEQSHGQSFFALLINRLHGNGFYIFDEPEAALSPQKQMSALTLIDGLVQSGSQLIIATHSPIIMAYPEAFIYELSEAGISRVNYEETEHFQITRNFLNRHEKMLAILLNRLPLRD